MVAVTMGPESQLWTIKDSLFPFSGRQVHCKAIKSRVLQEMLQ